MARDRLGAFREVWAIAAIARARPGDPAEPLALAGRELRSGREVVLGLEDLELRRWGEAPYPTDPQSLLVAYDGSAELGVHLALGWPRPDRVLDLHAEFRNRTNGLWTPGGANLLGALLWYGIDTEGAIPSRRLRGSEGGPEPPGAAWESVAKKDARARAGAILKLLEAMAPKLDLDRALLRGRYMGAVAAMERSGIPTDVAMLKRLREGWAGVPGRLAGLGVADHRHFRRQGARPSALELCSDRSGSYRLDPDAGDLHEAPEISQDDARPGSGSAGLGRAQIESCGRLLAGLAVGSDGRNRTQLGPFGTRTGRNQPRMDCSLLGAPRWLRGLIKPSPGRALASIDWAHQEYGIAAALSGDEAMIRACVSGDPYLAFGHIAGLITENSTAEHVGLARRRCKTCALAVLNGMGAESLGSRLDLSPGEASELLLRHKRAYPRFWDWSDGAEMVGLLRGELRSVFGWTLRFEGGANPRAIRNFPCQANGAEMLRWACSLAIERGVEVAAPAHDALLVEGPTDSIEDVVAEARDCMARASEAVLSGFRLATTARTLRWPDRFLEENAQPIWDRVVGRMKAVE